MFIQIAIIQYPREKLFCVFLCSTPPSDVCLFFRFSSNIIMLILAFYFFFNHVTLMSKNVPLPIIKCRPKHTFALFYQDIAIVLLDVGGGSLHNHISLWLLNFNRHNEYKFVLRVTKPEEALTYWAGTCC